MGTTVLGLVSLENPLHQANLSTHSLCQTNSILSIRIAPSTEVTLGAKVMLGTGNTKEMVAHVSSFLRSGERSAAETSTRNETTTGRPLIGSMM